MSMETEICLIRRRVSQDLHYWTKLLREDICGPGRLTKIQTTSRPDHILSDAWIRIWKAAQRREKQEWTIEKTKLAYARKLRGIYSIDPSDEEYQDIIQNARRKLETSKAAAMPCKRAFSQACIRETVVSKTEKAKASEAKATFSCITEANESTRQRTESVTKRIHEEYIAGKGQNSVCRKQWRFQMQSCSGHKEWKKLETIPAWDVTKVRSKKEVIKEAQKNNNKVHFASLMDFCHLKNSELEPQFQKYNGRVFLRGDIVKDDPGAYAVFTERGSSASLMAAAKVMDIISRLSGCAGQAADAVSAETQVKMEDGPELLKSTKSECPDIWIRLPRHKWPKSWSSMEDPVVPLERNLWGHPLAGLLWERQFEKILLKHGWEKVPNWECLFAHREKGLFLSVYVDDIKLAGKKQNLDPMWKLLNQHHFLIMYTWCVLKDNVKQTKILLTIT